MLLHSCLYIWSISCKFSIWKSYFVLHMYSWVHFEGFFCHCIRFSAKFIIVLLANFNYRLCIWLFYFAILKICIPS